MESQDVLLGSEAKVRINDRVYAVVGLDIQAQPQLHDVANTESENYEDRRTGFKGMTANLEAQFIKGVNPFAAPLSLKDGEVVDCKIYPAGLEDPDNRYWMPKALVASFGHTGPVRAPQGFRVQLMSKLKFYRPHEHPDA
jgi:hypothetical protein